MPTASLWRSTKRDTPSMTGLPTPVNGVVSLPVVSLPIAGKSSIATHEGGNVEGPSGRHPARGAGVGPAARLCGHGGAPGTQRRPGRPADRDRLSGPAPARTGRPDPGDLVRGGRPPPPRLRADAGGAAGPGHGAYDLARILCSGLRAAAARAADGEPGMRYRGV